MQIILSSEIPQNYPKKGLGLYIPEYKTTYIIIDNIALGLIKGLEEHYGRLPKHHIEEYIDEWLINVINQITIHEVIHQQVPSYNEGVVREAAGTLWRSGGGEPL